MDNNEYNNNINNNLNNNMTGIAQIFTVTEIKRIARGYFKHRYRQALVPYLIYTLLIILPPMILMIISFIRDEPDIRFTFSPASQQPVGMILSDMFYVRIGYMVYALLVDCAMKVSIAQLSLSVIREEHFSIATLLTGFRHYWQSIGGSILESVYKLLWSIVTLIPAMFIFSLAASLDSFPLMAVSFVFMFIAVFFYVLMTIRYTFWSYIAADDRSIRPTITIAASVSMLKGSEISLLTMLLSFAGWVILIALGFTFSIEIMLIGSGPVLWFLSGALFTACTLGTATLFIYVYTSLAVFYSAVSGNFNVKNAAAH